MEQLKKSDPKAYEAEMKKKDAAAVAAAKSAQESAERAAYMKKYYLNDWTFDSTNDKMGAYRLLYPDQIKHTKTKLIVHHTATDYSTSWNQEQVREALQRIYKYHTIDRNFGDIGYNFLIDHLGNIYEGRVGGEGAVGMHVAYNNVASIGISLLGNYAESEPTQAQINALVNLMTAVARKYNIDPSAQENYFQPSTTAPYVTVKKLSTIVGHSDIVATACPGKFVYSLLPFIRSEIAKRLKGERPSEIVVYGEVPLQKGDTGGSEQQRTPQRTSPTPSLDRLGTGSSEGGKDFPSRLKKLQETQPDLLKAVVQVVRERYKGNLPKATNFSEKNVSSMALSEVSSLSRYGTVDVLLYELTTKYSDFQLQCGNGCSIQYQEKNADYPAILTATKAQVQFVGKEILLNVEGKTYTVDSVLIQDVQYKGSESTDGNALVQVVNYDRKSYAGIPRNTFRG